MTKLQPRARRIAQRTFAAVLALLIAVATVLVATPATARADTTIRELSVEERDELYSHARLGAIAGSLTELKLGQDYPDADLQLFSSESDIIAALAGNKIDYAFVSEFYGNRYMETNEGYEYITPMYITFNVTFAVQKGNDKLREKIDAIIERMRADGTLDAINQKWVIDRDYSMDDVPTCDTGDDVLVVATTGTEEPYTFIKDGAHAGAAVEVAQRIASELGMRVEYQDMPTASEITAVASGKADIATQLSVTEERKQQVDFTSVYISLNYGSLAKVEGAQGAGLLDNFAANFKSNFKATFLTENRWQLVLNGLQVTCLITVGAFALGTVLAAGLSWLSHRRSRVARAFVIVYNKLSTGIPVLVWLMILYYVIFSAWDVPAVAVAVLCFGLQSASGIYGVFETGLAAVDNGQVEASLAMGFSHLDTFRNVVLPQAAARVWSLYSGQFTALIKATSIVGYIAIQDLTKASDIIRSRTFQAFFPLIATAVVYFAIIALCGWVFARLGLLLDPKRRRPQSILKGVQTRE